MFLIEYFRWELTGLFHTIYIGEAASLTDGNSFFEHPHSTLSSLRINYIHSCGGLNALFGIDVAGQRDTRC